MSSFDLDGRVGLEVPEPVSARKSARLAWAASLVVPGSGQLYAGARTRGLATLVATVLAIAGMATGVATGVAVRGIIMLYAFASVDAYFTAREANRGLNPSGGQNPRVAAVLNAITNGFGYFYLGERRKGLMTFVALAVLNVIAQAIAANSLRLGLGVAIGLECVLAAIAVDAYRIAEGLAAEPGRQQEVPETPAPDLPRWVPLSYSGAVLAVYALMVVLGAAFLMQQQP